MQRLISDLLPVLLAVSGCMSGREFVRVENGQFVMGDDTVNFVGTNFWYGPIIASEGRGGDRARLERN